ncbi:MAG TPA: single-stranded DNA-binding protein [Gaiellaceae bacterium]|jgi:single-strand DNA-binding protein|nr:single-stranded DNA-binding protein [Gaiellaceae bacterium]
MNTVSLIGNLATEVELRDVGEDKKVASFLLAVNRATRDGGADFVGISVWDRQAEVCAEYLTKGQRVGIAGRLRSHSWEEEGKRRTIVDVVAQRVDFLNGPRSNETEGAEVIPFEAATA